MSRRIGAVLGVLMLCLLGSPSETAQGVETDDDTLAMANTHDGNMVKGRMTREQVAGLPPSEAGKGPVADPATTKVYSYDSTTACTTAQPGSAGSDTMCAYAVRACLGQDGPGPLTRIWRQVTVNGQVVESWRAIGMTCYGNALPNARPMLTMAMIQEAVHVTPWATARTEVEPVGNVTLVGLDTFYRVEWSAEGFEPAEVEQIDPGRMLGYRVDIRPKVAGLLYRFGDGAEFGPTPSLGGRYPSGPIRHQYPKTGVYPVNVVVTWGADFRIDGGEWAPVPGVVTVPGPVTSVEAKAARAVLVQR